MARTSAAPDAADPVVLDGFSADARRSGAGIGRARSRLAAATISPTADRFGLLSELVTQHDDAKRQALAALASLADGFDHLDTSAHRFAEAFRVSSEVR